MKATITAPTMKTIHDLLQQNPGNTVLISLPAVMSGMTGVAIARVGRRKTTLAYTDGTKESGRTTPAIAGMDSEAINAFALVSEIQNQRARDIPTT